MSPLMAQAIQTALARRGGPISFAEFMQMALYHPTEGYYRRDQKRVGFGGTTDFFTASSTGGIFGELVVNAAARLLGSAALESHHFVEIGAEPGGGVLPPENPFLSNLNLRAGDPLTIPDPAVVFSNELFDAQPFHRLVFQDGQWREIGVAGGEEGLVESILAEFSAPVERIKHRLPPDSNEGYHIDLPLAAVDLLNGILSATPWRGLLILFDYGKSWRELIEAVPQGTARAYRHHRQSNHLLADPGEQDLTCHVCWDWLQEALQEQGFSQVSLQSQESFFMNHSVEAIERIISHRPGQFDPRRQNLHQLLHPGNMGQKFQVLHGQRTGG